VPDVVGANAADAETQLKSTGFVNVNLESANPDYKSVWVASNWTVLSSDPAPGCVVSRSRSITVYVTK
jgi:beta-lactam-binding protein with PASTA domain